MSMDLKQKAMDVAGESLKQAAGGEKLSANTNASEKLSRTVAGEAERMISKTASHSLSRKQSQQDLSNRDVASDALLHRTKPEERLGVTSLAESDPNAKNFVIMERSCKRNCNSSIK